MSVAQFTGKIAAEQEWLTREYVQLYRQYPSVRDVMLARDRNRTVIFDGLKWRELDFNGLTTAIADRKAPPPVP